MKKYREDHQNQLDFELVDVVENRGRAEEISRQTGILHESPQAILLDRNGRACWHCSHRQVTREALLDAVTKYNEETE